MALLPLLPPPLPPASSLFCLFPRSPPITEAGVRTHSLDYAIESAAIMPIYQKRRETQHQHHKAHQQTDASKDPGAGQTTF
jgi:hypothetical protein